MLIPESATMTDSAPGAARAAVSAGEWNARHLRARNVAFLGSHAPRRCGIATFTADLCEAVAAEFPETKCIVGAVTDRVGGYDYPGTVRFEIQENEPASYLRAAEFFNINNVEVLCVQHEFGIYGGKAGAYLLELMRQVRMPVVTTLHTILRAPDKEQRRIMKELDALSSRFVVMAERGRTILDQRGCAGQNRSDSARGH